MKRTRFVIDQVLEVSRGEQLPGLIARVPVRIVSPMPDPAKEPDGYREACSNLGVVPTLREVGSQLAVVLGPLHAGEQYHVNVDPDWSSVRDVVVEDVE